MTRAAAFLLFALSASAQSLPPLPPCVAAPCTFSTNLSWDSAGTEESATTGIWGGNAARTDPIPFVSVPAGYAVRIVHVSGDEIAGPVPKKGFASGTAYVLIGLETTTPYASSYVRPGLGSEGCFLYRQSPVSPAGSRIAIDTAIASGTLNADNTLVVKQALFLNTTGVEIHMEATLVVDFVYVKTQKETR